MTLKVPHLLLRVKFGFVESKLKFLLLTRTAVPKQKEGSKVLFLPTPYPVYSAKGMDEVWQVWPQGGHGMTPKARKRNEPSSISLSFKRDICSVHLIDCLKLCLLSNLLYLFGNWSHSSPVSTGSRTSKRVTRI